MRAKFINEEFNQEEFDYDFGQRDEETEAALSSILSKRITLYSPIPISTVESDSIIELEKNDNSDPVSDHDGLWEISNIPASSIIGYYRNDSPGIVEINNLEEIIGVIKNPRINKLVVYIEPILGEIRINKIK